MHEGGLDLEVFGLDDEFAAEDVHQWTPLSPRTYRVSGLRSFGYSRDLFKDVLGAHRDLMHLHALWMHTSIVTLRLHLACEMPFIVTPNGMLEPWALRNSAWKKRIAGFLYEKRMLRLSSCLQANTAKELHDIRAYGLTNPVCIVPNGVDLPDLRGQSSEVSEEKRILLFLGRLHPKKGLVNAIRAWKEVLRSKSRIQNSKFSEWQFVIAGWDQGGHEAELKRICTELGLTYGEIPASEFLSENCKLKTENLQIVFIGPVFGQDKDHLLRSASAFILPSFSEGLPMSVLEAWSYRLPVLMTDHCNLPEGFAVDAALRISTDTESIAEGIGLLFRSPTSDLRSLGRNGRSLVESQFTWRQVAAQMKEVYEWVLGGGSKPGCLECD